MIPIAFLILDSHGLSKTGGRNNKGRTTVSWKGGGHKRRYRQIDFKRYNLNGHVRALEYDPNRSAHLARIVNSKGKESYIIAPEHLNVGMSIFSGGTADIKLGNSLRVRDIPVGTFIHNIEIHTFWIQICHKTIIPEFDQKSIIPRIFSK